jgi:hypothetical protein
MLDRRDAMSLSFPNDSRSYDATRQAVRFWGYDSAMEVSFFVTYEALKRLQSDLEHDQAAALVVFDRHRNAIYAAATKIYARGRKGSYELTAAEF